MKKILLSVLPIFTFSFLVGCGSKISYTVTEQEFKDALSFKDVQYLQENAKSESIPGGIVNECSPTVYHAIDEDSTSYSEKFVTPKDGATGTWTIYSRINKASQYTKNDTTDADRFVTPQKLDFLNTVLKGYSADNFADYTYNDSDHTYNTSKMQSDGTTYTFALSFGDKKITSAKINYVKFIVEYTFTYNAVTPTLPN